MNTSRVLAIVIPYFKISFFEELLDSLKNQTCQNFNIYIGDDCSVDSPVKIINNYKNILNINYHRFENNLGLIDLVAQWQRCLELVNSESWIWVLPDDDVPSSNVVKEFYKGLEFQDKYSIKVFRMAIRVVDKYGQAISQLNEKNPIVETNIAFYERVVRGKTNSTLGDNIFHAESLVDSGGFVNFPKAWGSDHATILQVAQGGVIYMLENAQLSFRMSGENISSESSDGVIKLGARINFASWLKKNEKMFSYQPSENFYKYFYWKGEDYALNEWSLSIKVFFRLFKLRVICFESYNFFPIIKIVFKKLGKNLR